KVMDRPSSERWRRLPGLSGESSLSALLAWWKRLGKWCTFVLACLRRGRGSGIIGANATPAPSRISPMATPDDSMDDIFLPGGRLRAEFLDEAATAALRESLRLARETRW